MAQSSPRLHLPSRNTKGENGPHKGLFFNMTTFQCLRSGNLVSFSNEDDIKQLRSHEGYKEIQHEEEDPIQKVSHENAHEDTGQEVLKKVVQKKRGRPARK